MATHSSTLAWKIPWTEEPSRLQSMESLRVGHDRATSLSLSSLYKIPSASTAFSELRSFAQELTLRPRVFIQSIYKAQVPWSTCNLSREVSSLWYVNLTSLRASDYKPRAGTRAWLNQPIHLVKRNLVVKLQCWPSIATYLLGVASSSCVSSSSLSGLLWLLQGVQFPVWWSLSLDLNPRPSPQAPGWYTVQQVSNPRTGCIYCSNSTLDQGLFSLNFFFLRAHRAGWLVGSAKELVSVCPPWRAFHGLCSNWCGPRQALKPHVTSDFSSARSPTTSPTYEGCHAALVWLSWALLWFPKSQSWKKRSLPPVGHDLCLSGQR